MLSGLDVNLLHRMEKLPTRMTLEVRWAFRVADDELCRYTCHTSGSSHLKGLLHSWTGWVDVQHIQIYPSCQPTHPRHWHGVCRIHIGCQDTGTNADVESACNVEICRMAVGCQLTDPIPDMEQMIVHSFANLQLQIGHWSRDESFQVIS